MNGLIKLNQSMKIYLLLIIYVRLFFVKYGIFFKTQYNLDRGKSYINNSDKLLILNDFGVNL